MTSVTAPPLLRLAGVTKTFAVRGRGARERVAAVAGVSFDVAPGECVGLVGSSGAGKSTVARLVAGLLTPDAGAVTFDGRDRSTLDRRERRALGRRLHLIFQDPYTSLPPRTRVAQAVAEPLVIHRTGQAPDRRQAALDALEEVGLSPAARFADRWCHELSGGERQRVALARALVLRPALVVADEPAGMVDASARLGLHVLMADLRRAHQLSYLYITHDLALTDGFCDRLVVLHRGRVVEDGPTGAVLERPADPWTRTLVDAARRLQPPPHATGVIGRAGPPPAPSGT